MARQNAGRLFELFRSTYWQNEALKLVRFALVGGSTTLLYAIFAIGIHEILGSPVLLGHAIAFLLAVPLSYLGQRRFTFLYKGRQLLALKRFLVTSGFAFAVSTGAVYLSNEILNWHYLVATGITVLVVPLVTFVTMLLWVFVEPDEAGEKEG